MVIKEDKISVPTETLLLGKPIAKNIGLVDGQTLVYNRTRGQWEPGLGTRFYAALLTQSGTNAPTVTLSKNTLGFTVSWTRVGVGHYKITGKFPLGKTFPYTANYNTRTQTLVNNELYAVVGWAAISGWNENGTTIHLYSQDMDGNLADGLLTNYPFRLEIFL